MQREVTEPLYLDLEIPAGATLRAGAAAVAQRVRLRVSRRRSQIGDTQVPVQRMAILANDAGQRRRRADGARAPARALLIAGKPLGEPIAQYGPFVMNTNDEIFQAVQDYQAGQFAATA